jgi:hypothetical protein
MLRNVAKGHVWQFGVTALPAFWPFPHLKLKSRVLFAPLKDEETDLPLDDPMKQHRLRSVCKGWREIESEKFILRLPDGMRALLAETAQRHGRSMNAEVVTALAWYLAESDLRQPVGPESSAALRKETLQAYVVLMKLEKTVDHLSQQVEKLNKSSQK